MRNNISIIMPDEINTNIDLYSSMLIAKIIYHNLPIDIYGKKAEVIKLWIKTNKINENIFENYNIYPDDDINKAFENYIFTIIYDDEEHLNKAIEKGIIALYYTKNEFQYDSKVIQLYGDIEEDLSTLIYIINNKYKFMSANWNNISKRYMVC